MRPAILLFFASTLGFASTWSGFLVDSNCYTSEEHNISPHDTLNHVNRDMAWEIQFCAAKPKTKKFAVVQEDWDSLAFDSAGDAKARDLVVKAKKKGVLTVVVNGQLNKKTIQVDSIAVANAPQ